MTLDAIRRPAMLLATLLAVAALAVLTDHPTPAANAQAMTEVEVWSATMTVGDQSGQTQGYSSGLFGTLSGEFTHQSTGYTISAVIVSSLGLTLGISPFPGTDRIATWTLKVDGTEYALADASVINDSDSNPIGFRWTSNAPSWSSADSVALSIVAKDADATGAATVTGTAEVGRVLTGYAEGITDLNGQPAGAQGFTYQWVRVDSGTENDITGATAPRYFPTSDDVGKTFKVKVSFEDLDGFDEGPFTSAASAAVQASNSVKVVWSATMTSENVVRTIGSNELTFDGYAGPDHDHPAGSLDPATFTVDGATHTVTIISIAEIFLQLRLSPDLPEAFTLLNAIGVHPLELDSGAAGARDTTNGKNYSWTTGVFVVPEDGERVAVALALHNNDATGAPTITGSPHVGQELTADTSTITDANGLPTDLDDFTYQWLRVRSGADTEIPGATGPTYPLNSADLGKLFKVRVSFTDLDGFEEGPLTSAASGAIRNRRLVFGDDDGILVWSVTMKASSSAHRNIIGYDPSRVDLTDASITTNEFTYNSVVHTVSQFIITTVSSDEDYFELRMVASPVLSHYSTLVLVLDGTDEFRLADAQPSGLAFKWPNSGLTWRRGQNVDIKLVDTEAVDICDRTGWVRDKLLKLTPSGDTCGFASRSELAAITTLDFSGFGTNHLREGDFDGLTRLTELDLGGVGVNSIHYRDGRISGTLSGLFSNLTNLEVLRLDGNGFHPRLEDDAFEGLGSLRELDLRGFSENPEGHDGRPSQAGGLRKQGSHALGSCWSAEEKARIHPRYPWNPRTGSPRAFLPLTSLRTYNWDADFDTGRISNYDYTPRAYASNNYSQPPDGPGNLQATRAGRRVTLTWDAPSGVTVAGYRIERNRNGNQGMWRVKNTAKGQNGRNVPCVADSTIFFTYYDRLGHRLGTVGADQTTFTDNLPWRWPSGGYSVWSLEYYVTAITASGESVPVEVNGPIGGLAGEPSLWVYDAQATEGDVKTLVFVVIRRGTLTETARVDYFTADGSAIRGDDYRPTSGTLTFGPGESLKTVVVPIIDDMEEDSGETFTLHLRNPSGASIVDGQATGTILNTEAENISATGLPTISGTPQVGETLTVVTSGIADADGLDHAIFSYQWFSDDGIMDTVIAGATGPSYTLSAADLGQSIKVRVNFTDDRGSQETLTSAATDSVAARPNNPATGLPTIGGTAQVGKTLTADVSAIADEDGLDNATFAYQWVSNEGTTDADIEDATASTYKVAATDVDRTLKVKVSFTDDRGHEETLTSARTEKVAASHDRPYQLHATAEGGAIILSWQDPNTHASHGLYQILRHRPELGEAEPLIYVGYTPRSNEPTFTDSEVEPGVLYVYAVKAVKDFLGFLGPASDSVEIRMPSVESGESPETNSPATGAPTISGTVQVGETLTASTSGIADADGLDNAEFNYQWLTDDADIQGATGSTYILEADDEGKTIRVRVTFTDDAGNGESLTSEETDVIAARPNSPATGAPTITGTAQVGETLTAHTSDIADSDGLADAVYAYQWLADDEEIQDATGSAYTLGDNDEGKTVRVRVSFTDDAGNKETLASAATAMVATKPNSPATGLPTISGTAQVGETLTVSTSGIADEDGLDDASFSYQWIAGGSDISGATGSTYTLTSTEQGKTIKVRVSFTDDANNQETLTSEATAAVAARPNSPATGAPTIGGTAQVGETLTAHTSEIADSDGMDNAVFTYQWIHSDGVDDADIQGATGSTYTLGASDEGKTVKARVSFTDNAGNGESLTSAATAAVAPKPNAPATGLPTISGTAQVGETLTADTSGIADADGLNNASFAYQWLADDSEIAGATSSTYTPTDDDEGKAVKVKVSFTDDAGNEESLISAPTSAVAPPSLTASLENTPTSHNGTDAFTFELRFSEELKLSYKTLRDHAFTVTGGTVTRAQRLDKPSNVRWRVAVQPGSNGDVTIVLPVTTSCDDQGAVCTQDGRKLSSRLELTVPGPSG